ncbi:MAG: DinB family protein, partial [Candidatus Latescibacterota bacterium]|nr:DinB family protein [Candidatus Latescibacterota bacterium]
MSPSHRILDMMSLEELGNHVADARARALDLMSNLSDEQLLGPKLDCVNPGRWEIGHHAWFQSQWVLRNAAG